MTPGQIEQVFGRGRLKMVTGEHVEVYREAMGIGERRRYTKRFLATSDGDFGPWTEREWRILARLIGHGIRCVPDVVQFDGGAMGGMRLVQTYDAGVTVDQWATLLPVTRERASHRHVFEDCAHWWALAQHCIAALDEIHALGLLHLDIKADNICVPYAPADFDPQSPRQQLQPVFARLALIDFAFSLVSREPLATPLPIGWQKDYDYQSPRLLRALEAGRRGDLEPTRELDWRCDLYSLAAMLKRYLPGDEATLGAGGWTAQRYDDARALIYRLRDSHDRDVEPWLPHRGLIDYTAARLEERDLAASLAQGWTLARDAATVGSATPITPITPMTRIARSIRVMGTVRTLARPQPATAVTAIAAAVPLEAPRLAAATFDAPRADPALKPLRTIVHSRRRRAAAMLALVAAAIAVVAAPSLIGEKARSFDLLSTLRAWFGEQAPPVAASYRDAKPSPQAPSSMPGPPPSSANANPPAAAEPPRVETAAAPAPVPAEPSPAAPAPAPREPVASAEAPVAPAVEARTRPKPAPMESGPPTKRNTVASVAAPKAAAAPSSPVDAPRVAAARATPAYRVPPAAPPAGSITPPPRPSATSTSAPSIVPAPEPSAPASEARVATAGSAPIAITIETPRNNPPAAGASAAPNAISSDTNAAPNTAQSAKSAAAKPPRAPRSPPRDDLLSQLIGILGIARDPGEAPAPIEERGVPSASSAGRSNSATRAPGASTPVPSVAPAATRSMAETAAAAAASLPGTLPSTTTTQPAPPVAPPAAAPTMIAPPAMNPPATSSPWQRPAEDTPDALVAQGRRLLADTVPRVAAQAQPEISRVLWTASLAGQPAQIATIVEAAYRPWASDLAWMPAGSISPSIARRLHDDARIAATSGRNLTEALNLELRAFAANPRDAEIASYLALLYLRANPAQAETARQLAMHAIAASGARRTARPEDWGTLAVASAMSGRESDAVRAYLVEIALSSNVDRSCRAALAAYTSFGDRLRVPVSAMLYRARQQSSAYESPSCTWPSSWTTVARLPSAY